MARLLAGGWNVSGQSTPPPGTFTQISAGANHTCAISTDGSLICWGTITKVPIAGPFRQVSANGLTCAVRTDGSVGCWAGLAERDPTHATRGTVSAARS